MTENAIDGTFRLESRLLNVEIDAQTASIKVCDNEGRSLLQEAPGGPAFATVPDLKWRLFIAWYFFRGKPKEWQRGKTIKTKTDNKSTYLTLGAEDKELLKVAYQLDAPDILRCSIEAVNPGAHPRIRHYFHLDSEERFFGFGERMNSAEQRGNVVPVWTEEGAVGFSDFWGKMIGAKPWHPFPKGPLTTYMPMPWFISSKGYGLLVEGDPMTEFDLGHKRPDGWSITHWWNKVSWLFFYGPEPARIIERMTEHTGRITVPKPWIFAPWNDAVTGEKRVRKVAETCRREKIPSSGIWTEDWKGGKKQPFGMYSIFPAIFHPDRALYPKIEELAHDLHRMGYRWFAYFFPYMHPKSDHYQEAVKNGYLIKKEDGRPYHIRVFEDYGQVDLTNPEAREWMKSIFKECLDLGFDGWMLDFGEYTPPDSVFFNGKTGWEMHNRYPLLWQELAREFFDKEHPDGDYVFFVRSGYVGSQKLVPVMWSGDSNTDWEKYDGLPSSLPAALSAGLSGMPIWSTDIAGYMSPTLRVSKRELFYRWTQLGALSPVMRTHHGVNALINWSFDKDEETLKLYGMYARFHTALFPLFYSLAHEAAKTGLPIMRHMVIHYPDDKIVHDLNFQFMLGSNILVAPVVEKGARDCRVYIPKGEWCDYWTGERYSGGSFYVVPAPLDQIPLFMKIPSILVTYDAPVDTLVENAGEGIVGFEQADASMRITMFGEGEASLRLWDGTSIYIEGRGAATTMKATSGKSGAPLKDRLSPIARGEIGSIEGKQVAFELKDKKGAVTGKGSIRGQKRRIYTIALR